MLLEADQQLPPAIKVGDLLLVDRTIEKKFPKREGIYVLSAAVGLTVRRVRLRSGKFVLSGPDISEEVKASELGRHTLGKWSGEVAEFRM
jgi:hypothetical protein